MFYLMVTNDIIIFIIKSNQTLFQDCNYFGDLFSYELFTENFRPFWNFYGHQDVLGWLGIE